MDERVNKLFELLADYAATDTECTDRPYWIVAEHVGGKIALLAGVWFSRAAAERHFQQCRHRYSVKAFVYAPSGHASDDMRTIRSAAHALNQARVEAQNKPRVS
jgi:hypothetical protein